MMTNDVPTPVQPFDLDIDVDSFAIGVFAPEGSYRHGIDTILHVAGSIGAAHFSFDLPTRAGTDKDAGVSRAVEALLVELTRVARDRMGIRPEAAG
jgi:hypothetical protein